MNILTEYTLNHLKRNKKNTLSILIAITVGTILLSTVVLISYMLWDYELESTILRNGNYHGYFKAYINKSQIPYLRENQKVDQVYIMTEFISGKINLERPYISILYMDQSYLDNMPTKDTLMEGRLPKKSDEIVVMGNFIKENPEYKIGDKIKVELGHRHNNGVKLGPFELLQEGESFTKEKEKEYTIVGTISGKIRSYEPSYTFFGFLDVDLIDDNVGLTPFLRMKNPRTIYKDLPEIGKALGFNSGEEVHSEYLYKTVYNTSYLKLHGIFPPSAELSEKIPIDIIMFILFILFSMLLFVIIVYNVFTVWSNNRLKQLGILKSVGATPKQIRKTVRLEAVFLSIAPIISGVILGHLFCYLLTDKITSVVKNSNVDIDGNIFKMVFKTSPVIIGIIIVLAFITILLSIYSPARRLSKIVPIEAIRQGGLDYKHFKKKRVNYSPKNIVSSLARDSLNGNKKGFRTTIVSICISFIIMVISLTGIGLSKANRALNTIENYYTMNVSLHTAEIADENMIKEIIAIPEVEESVAYKSTYIYSKVKPEYASDEFDNIGGFNDNANMYYKKLDDGYEISTALIGLDKNSFDKFVKSQGEEPSDYYNKNKPKAILLNLVKEDINQPLARANFIPFLDDGINSLSLNEFANGEGYNFNIDIGLKSSENPIKDLYLLDYSIYLFIPKEILNSLMENFYLPGDYAHSERLRLLVGEENIEEVKKKVKDINKYYLPEDDYYIWSILDDVAQEEMQNRVLYLITFSIVFFLGIIGISNAYSSINNNLRKRRREFAMLKSIGITKSALKKMLNLEAVYYCIYPFLFSIPVSLLILALISKSSTVFSLKDLLLFLDFRIILSYTAVIFISIYLAYYFVIKKLIKMKSLMF